MTDESPMHVPSRGPAPRAVSMLGLLLAAALGLAGCSQEGRTIQSEDIVHGVAWDVSDRDTTVTLSGDTTWVMDLVLKVQIGIQNQCEAERSSLTLQLEGPVSSPLFVVTPVARYQADDRCNVGAAGDTVLTLVVQNVTVVNAGNHSFAIRGSIPVQIDFQVDATAAAYLDSTTRYEVRVEDKDTGAPLSGAIVLIERADTSELIGETTTNAQGMAFVTEDLGSGCSDRFGPPLSTPYTIKVSYSGRTMNLRMKAHPARCGTPEKAIIRV